MLKSKKPEKKLKDTFSRVNLEQSLFIINDNLNLAGLI